MSRGFHIFGYKVYLCIVVSPRGGYRVTRRLCPWAGRCPDRCRTVGVEGGENHPDGGCVEIWFHGLCEIDD